MATFYASVAVLVGIGALPWPTVVVAAALPALVKVWRAFDRPRPDAPPPRFPVWPLWFAAIAFLHTRRAGALLVAGLAVGAILGY
jgi:1,4-dihydroxy-2-naphthoate octaprenyltransferase